MSQRFDMETVAPVGYKAMIGLEMYLAKISLNHTQKELIKLRASQINGCAFCLDNLHRGLNVIGVVTYTTLKIANIRVW